MPRQTAHIAGKSSGFRVTLPAARGQGRTLVAKTCIKCGVLKMAHEFALTGSKRNPDPTCRVCHATLRRGQKIDLPPKPWGRRVLAASCRGCHRLLDPSEFPQTRDAPDWQCHDCAAARTKAWAEQHPDQVQHQRDNRQRQVEEIRQAAQRCGYEWTGPEIEVAVRDDLTIPEAARLLGRTIYGVRWVRRQIERDPRKQAFL